MKSINFISKMMNWVKKDQVKHLPSIISGKRTDNGPITDRQRTDHSFIAFQPLRYVAAIAMMVVMSIGNVWGSIAFTVGVTGNSVGSSDYNKMKLNTQFHWGGTDKGWLTYEMNKAGITFEGHDLYIIYMSYDDAISTRHMQFQKYKGDTQKWSWDAYDGVVDGGYWNSRIVEYGGARYDQLTISSGAKFYFDATGWSQTAIKFVVGHTYNQSYSAMTNVTGTKLYYLSVSSYDWASGIGVVGGSSRSGSNDQWLTDVSASASEYSGWKNYSLSSTGSDNAYLMINNGKAGQEPTMSYNASYSTLLNSTQTYNTVVKTAGGSYTSANSKATINITSYELTGQGTTTQRTPSISTSAKSATVNACRTATTRLQVGTVATGYQFDGWYTAATGGELVSTSTDYTYYPTSATTLYARFSEKTYSVTAVAKPAAGGIVTPSSATTYGQIAGGSITATDNTGYDFYKWYVTSGSGTIGSNTTASTTFKPTANSTLTAQFCPESASGLSVYKFQTKSSGLGTGNVCAAANTEYDMTTSNALSTLSGGTLTASATSTNRLKYATSAFTFSNGEGGVLRVDLDCPVKTGDVIRYINSATGSDYNAYVRHTSSSTSTNQLTLDSKNPTVADIVIPSEFNGKSTLYIVRGANNGALISYFEILRPYKITLDANTNGGKVNGNNTEVHYLASGETLVLPHATKSGYRFKGWFTTSGGSSQASNPYTPTATTTLYAQFEDCPTSDATVYKFQVKTGLTNGSLPVGVSGEGEMDANEGNYLTSIVGGTLTIHNKNNHINISDNSKFKFDDNGPYLIVNLDCALASGDVFKATTSTRGISVTKTASRSDANTIPVGTNQELTVPAGFVGEKTLYLWRGSGSGDTKLSYFEIYRPEACTEITPTFSTAYTSTTLTLGAGNSSTPAINKDGSSGAITWTSSNTDVATVNSSGVVTPKKVGAATITATVAANGGKCEGSVSADFTIKGTVTYNANGASGGSAPTDANTYAKDAKATVAGKNTLYKTNYVFAGWNTKANGSGDWYDPSAKLTMGTSNVTLYAQWAACISTSDFSGRKDAGNNTLALTQSDLTSTFNIINKLGGSTVYDNSSGYTGLKLRNSGDWIGFGVAAGNVVTVTTQTVNTSPTVTIDFSSATTLSANTDNIYAADGSNDRYFRIKAADGAAVVINKITIGASCETPAAPTISGTTSYTFGETITLTASHDGDNHDASTTYTWYKGADWATASAASPVQAAAIGSSGYTFTKTAAMDDAGTYWCKASNGTGCDANNSVGYAITVSKASISPSLSYASTSLYTGDVTATPTVTGNTGSGAVTYSVTSATPAGCVTVNSSTGVVTAVAAGTARVTASIAATTNYLAGSAYVDFTVSDPCFRATITKNSDSYSVSGNSTKDITSDASVTSGGAVKCVNYNSNSKSFSFSSDGVSPGTSDGYVEFIFPTGSILQTGSVIRVEGAADDAAGGLLLIDDAGTTVASQTNNGALDFTYTVTAVSTINGKNHLRLKRARTSGKNAVKRVTVTNCGEKAGYDITNGNPSHGTISITDGSSAITRADEDATVHISATPADGYSFTSWSVTKDAGGSVSVSTSSTANPATFTMPAEAVTVTATFTEITHTVNVAAGAHGTVSPSSVSGVGIATASGNITATPAEGYSFNEWTLPSGVTAASTYSASSNPIHINATADDKTITATWTPTNYTITYTLHDGGEGSVSGKTSYTIEDDDYDLPTPTWTGHVFLGWYATYSAGVYSDPVSILASGSTGNKTYHAKWADAVPVVWTITKVDDKLYKGGSGYNVKAVVNDAEWSGSASNLALSASDGVTLGTPTTSTVDSKAQIVADFSVGCDVDGDAIAFTLTGPAAGDDAAIEDEKEVNLDECPGGGGTLFSQNFNTATAVAYAANTARAYTKASGLANCVGNADNLFTSMTCNAKGDCGVGVNSTTGGNSASYAGVFGTYNNNTGYYWSLERTTNLASTAPTAVQITFDAYLAVVDNGTSKRAVEFLVGSGFDDGLTNAIPSTSEIYTGFGLITGSSSSKKHAVCKVGSTTLLSSSEVIDYASWKSFTWVINNSGESLTYTSPSGSSETVATGTWDLWVGTNKIVNDQAKNSGSSSFSGTTIQNLYIGSATGVKHEFRLDNVIVTNLGALSSGGIDTDLSWSGGLSDGDDVDKNDVDADFTYTASKSNNSLGEITYSSSNTSVATVNSSGKVHIIDHGTTTITATVAACGCFNGSSISYTLEVANTCDDAAGTVTATNLGCEGVLLSVSGYTDGATIQWYKDGESLGGSYTNATCTVTVAGTYYAVTHKTCNLTSNSVTLAAADDDINPTIFADEFSVKDGRWFGYRLMQLEEGQSWSVKTHPTGWTYETHYRITKDANNILSIEGNVDVASAANKTLTLTITDNCSGTKDVNITIHELVSTAKPTIAWIATGTKGDKTNVAAGESTNTALYKFLKDSFDITPRNCYWTTREDSLVKEYSKYDLIILTDYPNSKSGPGGSSSASTSYTNAIGLLIDHKPILTFEAFVAGCPNWGIPTNPSNTATTQTHLTLLCNAKDIFKDNTDKFAAGEDIEVTTASSGQALQGFPIAYAPDFVFIGKITDNDSKQYVACCERQHEISARMMVFGLNSSIMGNMTDDGKKMVDGFIDYLLLMDPADIPDCSVIFQGGGADNSWYTADNWESGSVPSDPYVTVRIDVPCVIPSHTDAAQAGSIKIHQGGAFTGSLTIQPQGRLIVEKSITRIEGNAYTVHKPTTASDLSIQTNSTGNGVLVMGSHDGTNRATVGFYTKAHKDGSGHWINQFIGTPFYPGNDILQDYYGSYIYEFDPTRPEPVGDENDPRWVNKKKGYHANAFWGYNILRKDAAETTLWMEGQLCSSKSKTLSLYYNGSSRTENMFANSWMAPIDIASMTSAFTNCEATVYILNSGTKAQIAAASEGTASATSAGQYIVLPVASAPWTSPTVKVIPSMQAFSVYATGANAKVTLDYKTMVLDPAKEAAKADLTVATRAPRKAIVRNTTKPDIMRLQVDGEGGYGDVIYMLMRGDFTTGFENGYDGRKMMGDAAAPQMYAVSDAGNMTINCVAEAEGTQIGFKPGEDTHYTFSFAYDGDEELYLNDIKEQKSALISEEKTYEFYVEEGDDVNRFYISHQPLGAPAITTDVENIGTEVPQARKIIYNDKLYIIRGGRVYSAEGALVR